VTLTLQLRHCPGGGAQPNAWFLAADSSARWLEELARCDLTTMDVRLFVVPISVADRRPVGLLVIPSQDRELPHSPAGFACRLIAGRLFVPVDAVLQPPVKDEEIRTLCRQPVSFFHPVFGLSSFEEVDCLRVSDLILPPDDSGRSWNHACPGSPALPELTAVVLAQPPSMDDVFGDAGDDVGAESPLDLPPAPDEAKEGTLANVKRTLQKTFAKAVASAMGQLPHAGSRRSWVNDAEDWARRQLSGISEQLENLRHKELHRLLELFKSDPEAALRHAIPLSAFAHRGRTPPGASLGSRIPNFDLSRLGGRAADFWNVPGAVQVQLRNHYRALANREMQLGRHQRAAYIFAELLGDIVSAVNALKQGKYFREAAIIYDEHLKSPIEAAKCLADGGLLLEAIERYEKMDRWLDVADLQVKLGNQAAANEALRRVVAERLAQSDILGAAKLVEERLHETDEALAMLLDAWPSSQQATGCVGAAFQMLARLGRHDTALELLGRLKRQVAAPQVWSLITVLGAPARDYPHEPVRRLAADFSRVLIAQELGRVNLPVTEAGKLVEQLVRLAPQDRLLARDANRHLTVRRESELRARRVTPPPLPGNQPVIVRLFELPRQMEWIQLRSEWHFFYAIGLTAKRLTLLRGIWEGEFQSLSWDCLSGMAKSGLLFEPTRQRGQAVMLKPVAGPDFKLQSFPATPRFFEIWGKAGTPDWLKPQHWPVAFGEESIWTAHAASGQAVISCHDLSAKLLRTVDVTEELLSNAERGEQTRLCLTVVGSQVAVALGNRLVLTRSDGQLTSLELPGQVVGLLGTLPHTRAGVAIMLEHGAAMHWLGAPGLIELDRDLTAPQGVFVPGGPLVLVAEKQMMLLEVDSSGVRKVTRVPVTGPRPIGISGTTSPGQFAVLSAKGEMTVYGVPQ